MKIHYLQMRRKKNLGKVTEIIILPVTGSRLAHNVLRIGDGGFNADIFYL